MNQPLIQMNTVAKVFETDAMETHALSNINLTIERGDYLAITGPSGCGKSTLLSILGLMDMVTSGSYQLNGADVSSLTLNQAAKLRNKEIGFIFQSFNLLDDLSVLDNVILPLRYSEMPLSNTQMKDKAKSCLDAVGLTARLSHKPNQLSGGQQQRVAIARALVTSPSILLVDEATGNLDSNAGNQVMELLANLHQNGTTLCMVTHDHRYANMAKRTLSMLDGKLLRTMEG